MTDPFARPTTVADDPWAQPAAASPAPSVPAQPAPAQPAAAPASPAGADPFGGPAPRADRPRLADLYGRLLLIMPKRMQYGLASKGFKNDDGTPKVQDRMTMDVVVLDGGTLHFGGKPHDIPPTPHTKTAEVPIRFDGVYDSHAGIISQCSTAYANYERQKAGATLGPGEVTMVLGRLTVGEKKGDNKPPFIVTPPTDDDKAVARAWIRANHRDPFGSAS